MSHELHYTSVPRGLKPGTRGFCTVACTHGLPAPLADRLEALSGYRQVYAADSPDVGLNPVVFAHLCLPYAGRTMSVLSRIAYAGLDYTDRTNKYAHHVLLDPHERPVAGPAWALSQDGFLLDRWEGEPAILPSGRVPRPGDLDPAVCAAWASLTGDAGWAGILAEAFLRDPRQPSFLVFDPGQDLLALYREAIALLPRAERWNVTFSTYYTSLPPGVACAWRGVLRGSPEERTARLDRGNLLIDLAAPDGSADGGPLVTLARTGERPAAAAVVGSVPFTLPAPAANPLQPAAAPDSPPPVASRDTYGVAPPSILSSTTFVPVPRSALRKPRNRAGRGSGRWLKILAIVLGCASVLTAAGVGLSLVWPEQPPTKAESKKPGDKQGKEPEEKVEEPAETDAQEHAKKVAREQACKKVFAAARKKSVAKAEKEEEEAKALAAAKKRADDLAAAKKQADDHPMVVIYKPIPIARGSNAGPSNAWSLPLATKPTGMSIAVVPRLEDNVTDLEVKKEGTSLTMSPQDPGSSPLCRFAYSPNPGVIEYQVLREPGGDPQRRALIRLRDSVLRIEFEEYPAIYLWLGTQASILSHSVNLKQLTDPEVKIPVIRASNDPPIDAPLASFQILNPRFVANEPMEADQAEGIDWVANESGSYKYEYLPKWWTELVLEDGRLFLRPIGRSERFKEPLEALKSLTKDDEAESSTDDDIFDSSKPLTQRLFALDTYTKPEPPLDKNLLKFSITSDYLFEKCSLAFDIGWQADGKTYILTDTVIKESLDELLVPPPDPGEPRPEENPQQ